MHAHYLSYYSQASINYRPECVSLLELFIRRGCCSVKDEKGKARGRQDAKIKEVRFAKVTLPLDAKLFGKKMLRMMPR